MATFVNCVGFPIGGSGISRLFFNFEIELYVNLLKLSLDKYRLTFKDYANGSYSSDNVMKRDKTHVANLFWHDL